MKNTFLCLIVISLINAGSCAHDDYAEHWANFISNPSDYNEEVLFESLTGRVSECGWGKPENKQVVPDNVRQDLFEQIIDGSNASLKAGLLIESCLDGGDLGDLFRSAGQYFDRKPVDYLRTIATSRISTSSFRSTLTMLPLELVDNVEGQTAAIGSRIRRLNEIEEVDLSGLVEQGIRALREQEGILSRRQR